jgi:hypothetical protein
MRMTRSPQFSRAAASGGGFGASNATVSADRILLSGNHGFGSSFYGPSSHVTMTDLTVRGTESYILDKSLGQGLIILGGARVTLQRALLVLNHAMGLHAVASALTATDLAVVDTLPEEGTGMDGRGLVAESATADITRARFERNRELAVHAVCAGTELTLRDVRISSTMRSDRCVGICNAGIADGLNGADGSVVSLERFLISQNENGLRFAPGLSTLLLRDGAIAQNTVGFLVSDDEGIVPQVDEGVLFFGNGQNVMKLGQ